MVLAPSGEVATVQGDAAQGETRLTPPFTDQPAGAWIVKAPSVGSVNETGVVDIGAPSPVAATAAPPLGAPPGAGAPFALASGFGAQPAIRASAAAAAVSQRMFAVIVVPQPA